MNDSTDPATAYLEVRVSDIAEFPEPRFNYATIEVESAGWPHDLVGLKVPLSSLHVRHEPDAETLGHFFKGTGKLAILTRMDRTET